jgi:hypothetical protein
MIIYKDIISGDELFSNTFPVKEIGAAYEVDAKIISIEAGDDDPDAETQVIDLLRSYNFVQVDFDKKSYMAYIKTYLNQIKTKLEKINPSRVPAFQQETAALVKKILGNFAGYEFFSGESMNESAMAVLLNYREDGVTPYFTFFKDGLSSEEKAV